MRVCGGQQREISIATALKNRLPPGQVTGLWLPPPQTVTTSSKFLTRPAATLGGFFNSMTPNLQIEYRAIDALLPYARNPRTHSPAQIAKIAASIVEFGWTQPILVDGDNGIIAGHGRLAAARKLKLVEVPVIDWDT